MLRSALICFAVCISASATAAGNASEIHKCATPTAIAYQGTPCSGAEMPAPAVVASAADDVTAGRANDATPRGAPVCDARPREPRRLPWRQATICIGMTDDEVLNLQGWGRPARIARTRATREWREEWSYDTRLGGPRQLYFVNGSLIAVERNFIETLAGPVVKFGFN